MEEIFIKNKLLIIPGYIIGLICLIIISYRTLIAFFSEGKTITIYINRFGEQFLDIAAIIIIWAICLTSLYFLYKTLLEEKIVINNHDNFFEKPQIKNISLIDLNSNRNYNENKTILFSKASDNLEKKFK